MQRRTKNWDSTTLTAIAQQVASNLGLTPVLYGLDANIGTQQQFNESDLHFLRRLLARYDADVQIVGTELHASPRSQAQRNPIEIDLNSQLKEVRVIADLSHQVTQITATGWDYTQGQRISVTSSTTSFGPGSGQTGKDWLQQKLGTRSEQLAQHVALNSQEAQALVDAEFSQRIRTFVVAHGVSEGNPNLRVGTVSNSTDSARASRTPTTPPPRCITSTPKTAMRRASAPSALIWEVAHEPSSRSAEPCSLGRGYVRHN